MKHLFSGMACAALLLVPAGCGFLGGSADKLRDLDFTVVTEDAIPQELLAQIDENRDHYFNMNFLDGEYLYIAVGYGEQETGGYSIEVEELYVTEDTIYFDTELYGPKKGETVTEAASYPYIVVRTEAIDYPVKFE